jgi:penicillin-binding protein 1B
VAASLIAFAIPYHRLAHKVDRQLEAGPFTRTFNYYSRPEVISVGDQMDPEQLALSLKRSGSKPCDIQLTKGTVTAIRDVSTGARLKECEIGPQLITNLSDDGREKRIFVHFSDLPSTLIDAIVSTEDKRFFYHSGFDTLRIAKAAYVDFRENRKEQGASTITMQLARALWLDRDKRWKRKIAELMITLHLERKLSKQQILEYYVNQVYLGGLGTYSINGFGAASHAYFNKDIRNLTLDEAATLAGLIQRPSYFNPFRFPERATERRNLVLKLMRENKYITADQYAAAVATPLELHPGTNELSGGQYFLDLAADELQKNTEGVEWHGIASAGTTIDLRLQRAAEDAVRDGMAKLDKQVRHNHHGAKGAPPQVALIALNPHTGEVLALLGGRDYTATQLDRVLARRPPGSAFKPFVYAAALNTAVEPSEHVYTEASTVVDVPTTFRFANQTYSPDNFEHQFHGTVTFRQALAKSMNVAAVRVGQMVGFDQVVALAKRAGMNENIQPTPAVAIGAYEVTPLEIAKAYTVFANNGVRENPRLINSVLDSQGTTIFQAEPYSRRVLDPRVAFLITDMLQEVIRSGTAAGVRSMGFKLTAAGKTGTSHDGWFAGYTSELLCVVWVGYDDYHELNVEGARSALPIWTQFMMEAAHFKQYRDVKSFEAPAGIVKATVDPSSGGVATPYCPQTYTGYFIDGTQPETACRLHSGEAEAVAETGEASPVSVVESVAHR